MVNKKTNEKRKFKFTKPPKFQDPEAFDKAIEDYFNSCIENEKPFTVTGLALSLGCDPHTLKDYRDCLEKDDVLKSLDDDIKHQISASVKRAYQICENYAEEKLLDAKISKSPIGYIFALKNFGWKDKVEQEITQKTFEVEVTE
ncbi:terminase small subunit [Clostridium baratii]|uniref:terminase small subunit n=1 Tax=Clostridium baratii TaxID=1561 RepID=UPI0030D16422